MEGFHFDRPIVVLQSDDWGRVGLRDQEGMDCLRNAGLTLGERPYDLYTLETSDDLTALLDLLHRHRDATGRPACVGMNFIMANPDFAPMEKEDFREIHLLPLVNGLPQGWSRPGLLDAYRAGIQGDVFHPALHGITHFCRVAVERALSAGGERAQFLRTLWRAGTPFVYWRMPWIGYEYWDTEQSADERFLPAGSQQQLVGQAVGLFGRLFSMLPHSACAPGYRANADTHRAWAQHGIRVAQNGPGTLTPPHIDSHEILQLYRTVEFEPATDPSFSLEKCVHQAEVSLAQGVPAVISLHSINFHSSLGGFRDRTIPLLDQFLAALETRYPNLLYLHDDDVWHLVQNGFCETEKGRTLVSVTKTKFTRRELDAGERAER